MASTNDVELLPVLFVTDNPLLGTIAIVGFLFSEKEEEEKKHKFSYVKTYQLQRCNINSILHTTSRHNNSRL